MTREAAIKDHGLLFVRDVRERDRDALPPHPVARLDQLRAEWLNRWYDDGPARAVASWSVDRYGKTRAARSVVWYPGNGGQVNQLLDPDPAAFLGDYLDPRSLIVRYENDKADDGDRGWGRDDCDVARALYREAARLAGLDDDNPPSIAYGFSAGGYAAGASEARVVVLLSTTGGALRSRPPDYAGRYVVQVITEGDQKVRTDDQRKAGEQIAAVAREYHAVIVPTGNGPPHSFHPGFAGAVLDYVERWVA